MSNELYDDPTETIREEWGHLSDMAENLRKAIDEMDPQTSEAGRLDYPST